MRGPDLKLAPAPCGHLRQAQNALMSGDCVSGSRKPSVLIGAERMTDGVVIASVARERRVGECAGASERTTRCVQRRRRNDTIAANENIA